ncbi:MAG TPA: hypothetical protein PLC65_02425, partial [Bacteroidia bacterium]|nr:hypothetical protein [Bacteroidia bacterium]
MKVIKHTIIAASAVGGVLLMSSAGFFTSKKAELSQIIIENNTAKDALPVQPNTAFKEGEVLTYR